MSKQGCGMCGGEAEIEFLVRKDKGEYEKWTGPCMHSGGRAEVWKSIEFMLAQFIRCGAEQDAEAEPCAGCAVERRQVMDLVWHYGQAPDDEQLIAMYREWSEEHYAAGFIEPSPELVRQFREDLRSRTPRSRTDYEQQMLDEFHSQEQE